MYLYYEINNKEEKEVVLIKSEKQEDLKDFVFIEDFHYKPQENQRLIIDEDNKPIYKSLENKYITEKEADKLTESTLSKIELLSNKVERLASENENKDNLLQEIILQIHQWKN